MAVWSLVSCSEEHNAHDEDLGFGEGGGQVVLRVAWANRFLLIADILGRAHPWMTGIRASSVSLEFDGQAAATDGSGQVLIPTDVLARVTYSSNVSSDLIRETLEPSVEFITQDYREFRWTGGDPIPPDAAPGKQLKYCRYIRTEMYLSSLHDDHFDLMGSVNDAAVTSTRLGYTFPIETLLYEPPRLEIVTDTTGAERFTLVKSFAYNPNGWNKFWRQSTQTWVGLETAAGVAYKNYPPEDFSNIT